MALLSSQGIGTPSLPAQGEQRRLILFQQTSGHPRGPLSDCLALARSVASELSSIDAKARHAAARDLLKLYNENWREGIEGDGEGGVVDVSNPEITEQQFMSTIMLTNVNIVGDSLVRVGYDDGGLFCGHAIYLISFDGAAFSDPDAQLVG